MPSCGVGSARREAAERLSPQLDVRLSHVRDTANRLIGLAYLTPALLFVAAFTAYPFLQMMYVSFTNWTLLQPPRFIGGANFAQALQDRQFWISLTYTLKYTLIITPILMIGGYAIALLTSDNTPLRRFTRAVIFIPVVIGLGSSSLLWYWLFSARWGLVNKLLQDIGIIDEPVLWLGVDADTSTYAIIFSVVWKVLGFGVILFVAAIQAIPSEINEATWSTAPACGSASPASPCR